MKHPHAIIRLKVEEMFQKLLRYFEIERGINLNKNDTKNLHFTM